MTPEPEDIGTSIQRDRDRLVFHAGPGEWFNQPHEGAWDMGDDAVKRAPSGWQRRLDEILGESSFDGIEVIVDLTAMATHVGLDFGYLVKLRKRLGASGARLRIVGDSTFAKSVALLGLEEVLDVYSSVARALDARGA